MIASLLASVTPARGQSQLVNANLVVVGHINTCTTGPTGTTGSAYACTLAQAITTYQNRACFQFRADVANSGSASLNLHGLGAKTITKMQGGVTTPLVANDIRQDHLVHVCYDQPTDRMQCQNCAGNVTGAAPGGSANQVQYHVDPTTLGGTSGLQVNATTLTSAKHRTTTRTASATLDINDGPLIKCDTAGGAVMLTLPAASGAQGGLLIVKTTADANACTVQRGGSDTINGSAATISLPTQWMQVDLKSDGSTNWTSTVAILESTVAKLNVSNTWSDGIKQTFNPDATNAGLNVGSHTADPSTLVNGDLWYNSTTNAVRARINGVSVPLGWTGLRSGFIPAGGLDVNGGCAVGSSAVLLTNGPKTVAVTCTDSTADSVETTFTMPDGWDAGTLTVELSVFNVGTNASTLAFEMSWIAKCVGPGEAPGAWAAVNHTTDAATAFSFTTTDNVLYHATSGAITPVGGCAAGDTVFLKGEVDATATTMTPMTDVKILGLKVEYTRNATD